MNIFPRENIDAISNNKKELNFQITDWFIPESDKQDRNEDPSLYSIMLYGTDDNCNTYCAKIVGYEPYFYIKPNESWEKLSDREFDNRVQELQASMIYDKFECIWKDRNTGENKKWMKNIIPPSYQDHFKGLTIEKKKDFWGFTNNKLFRFIKITVRSLALFNTLKYYFMQYRKNDFSLYESNIDPFLRYIHIQKIRPCGWVKIKKYEVKEIYSRCNHNIEVKWKDVLPLEKNTIAPLLIASFDIECNSSHGDFPVAKKDYKKLAQDLGIIAKAGYELNSKYIKSWITNAYVKDVNVDEFVINRLYSKSKINVENLSSSLDKIMKDILSILDKISNIEDADDGEEDDEEEKTVNKMLSVKEYNVLETQLNSKLTKALPELQGDKVIQIGTTVHKFGSSEIVYKNIISLDSCDDIENADVVSCKDEKELILKWKELIIELNPDVLIGYNIFGFDMEYVWERAVENDIVEEFSMGLGRLNDRRSILKEQKLASSAMGENFLKYFDMDGTVIVDLLKVMQREQKLDSYKLDNVATIFLGDKKDDLKPHEIFEKFKGNSADRCIIAKYCIQDCALVNRLMDKMKIIENNVGMGNVCLVPLNFLFRRGQGIKIFSLISKQCMDKNFLIPVIKFNISDDDVEEGYEGAIVLEPKEGIYLDEPIVVFDYGSLYPSSMIARNLSHDTYVLDEKYMIDDPNVEYMEVNYDLYEGIGDKKKKTGVKKCIFAQYKDGKKGIIPEILNMLLQERKNTRKKIEYQTAILKDGTEVFGTVTEKGDNVEYYNVDTNKSTTVNKTDIVSVKETYSSFEQAVFDALQLAYKITANSLYGQIGARTSPIYLKDIAASTTATGREMIMIAKDFVEKNYNAEVIYGDSVMPYTPITYKVNNVVNISTFEKIEGEWIEYKNFKPNDTDRYEKEQYLPNDMLVWTHKGWSKVRKIIRHKTIKKIYRVYTSQGLVDVTEDHSLLDDKCNIIKPVDCDVGQELLHSKLIIDVDKNLYQTSYNEREGVVAVNIKYQELIQKHFLILQSLNYNVYITFQGKLVLLNYSKDNINIDNKIKSLTVLHEKYDGYVYDIETEEGVFHGGIGNIILKNTDSIFCKFPLKDGDNNRVYGKESLKYAIEIGKNVEKNIVSIMPKPQKLNYEKSMYPFILLSKKRYVGNLYEQDVNKFKQKSMGIVLKRRDNANIVKKIYGGVIDIILNKQDIHDSIEYLREELNDLVNGKTSMDELVLSKTLRAVYKDPTKIAHKVLADRIGARDPGNKPAINDRIPYVYIDVPNAKLQGDRIENPEYILENNIKPDYLHYITNQIMKPVLQLYALCLDELPNNPYDIEYWKSKEEELKLKPLYQDDIKRKNRMDNLKLNAVKEILFDEFINKLTKPKEKKAKKEPVKKDKASVKIIEDDKEIEVKEVKVKKERKSKKNDIQEENKDVIEVDNYICDIKIISSTKTKTINAVAKLLNNKKVIWVYNNDNCKNKEVECKKIILNMLNENKTITSVINIKLNNKKFIKEYNIALAKYAEVLNEVKKNKNLMTDAVNNNDVGRMIDMKDVIIFNELLECKGRFKLLCD
jgi:DNA polymerase elongation subunit (family B)